MEENLNTTQPVLDEQEVTTKKQPINILSIIGCALPLVSAIIFGLTIILSNTTNSIKLIGVITISLIGLALNLSGFIISIIGLIRLKKHSIKGLTISLSVIGIIISIVAFAIFLVMLYLFLVVHALADGLSKLVLIMPLF